MPTTPTQPRLIHEDPTAYAAGPVTCLGLTFENDAARRAYFTEKLRAHLQDPAFRAIEGFPVGEDEAILALSDPPYYTACPNPFLSEIIADWTVGRNGIPTHEHTSVGAADRIGNPTYKREPFAADVSEGKNDPIYNAHSYHTKVPHKAIMRYILHYTEPGDVVYDGFCGTGMTGVAAQLCGDRAAVESLGFVVDSVGRIGNPTTTDTAERIANPLYQLGPRRAILNDLSPAATFIAYNYNTPVDAGAFEREATRILGEVAAELGWMYETLHTDGQTKGRINYTVWSEVFACPSCATEFDYFSAAVDSDTFQVRSEFACPHCKAALTKKALERIWDSYFDEARQETHRLVKYNPVLINYQLGRERLEKRPDAGDLAVLERIERTILTDWYPVAEMPDGERKGKDGYHLKGITHLHHFYFKRALLVLARLSAKIDSKDERIDIKAFLRFYVQGSSLGFTKMNRYQPIQFGRTGGSQVNRYFSGTLFVGSLISEVSPHYSMTNKLKRLGKLKLPGRVGQTVVMNQSTTTPSGVPAASVDYIFIDPPFGNNLHYSELNFFWEAWLRILTKREPEAVMDKGRQRTLADYQALMTQAFAEVFRVLKPGRWVTVEFHNSQNKVWTAIQEAMIRNGFVVADVRTLDKQQETYKQSIQKLVKQDLVISAYKPTEEFQQRFLSYAGTAEGVWDFVRQHLDKVPIVVPGPEGRLETIAERQNFLLFDRMVAYHIQRGVAVPMGAAHFYAGLARLFVERDGMVFLPDQVEIYEKARFEAAGVAQLALFVSDEKSAIQWLRQQLAAAPLTFQAIQPRFLRELHQARHEELPDLRLLLDDNFLQDEAGRWYVPDPNRGEDLEKLRLKSLLRVFEGYKEGKKKLRQFRTDAMRAGFAHAWKAKAYATIVRVADRLPEQVLQEDAELVMYYDNARNRV